MPDCFPLVLGVRLMGISGALLWSTLLCSQLSWLSEVLRLPSFHPIRSHITQAPDEV